MSSTNHFKFGASGINSATRGGFRVGVVGGADYGPTSTTGFWNGVTPPVGGYTIYVDKASQGPSIHVANNDSQCIFKLKAMGATGSTISDVLTWADNQANILVINSELVIGDLPGGGGLPSNSIEFVVDTEMYDTFGMEIDATFEITASIDWGDNQTEEMTFTGTGYPSHTFDVSGEGVQYTIRIGFSDANRVTRLEFYGND